MTTPDLSLKESFRQRKADPLLGVRRLARAGSSLDLRSLIPPSPPGGGTGGSEPSWHRTDLQNFSTPDVGVVLLCSTTELYYQVDAVGTIVNAQGGSLALGDSYWLGADIHFWITAPGFLLNKLPNQDLRFRVTARFPDGTAPTPDNTLWWREQDEDEHGRLDQALLFAAPGSPASQGSAWTLLLWSSFLEGLLALRRGRKLSLAICVESSLPFARGQLGLEVRSEVGWGLTASAPPADHPWTIDNIQFDTCTKTVFCVNCQSMVTLLPDWSRCSNCGATSNLMKPVAPEFIVVNESFGF